MKERRLAPDTHADCMKRTTLSLIVATMFICGCRNPGIVKLSPDTYLLSREDHGGIFGSRSALKAGVIRDANAFAEKKGKIAIPIAAKEHPVGILGDWASFELTFRVVDKNDPQASATNIWTSSSTEGHQGWRNLGGKAVIYPGPDQRADEHEAQGATIGQQLVDLQKAKDAGAITDAEFQAQKAKLLGKK